MRIKLFKVLTIIACLLATMSVSAQDRRIARPSADEGSSVEKRIALVIGNGSYESGPLKNPPNDASAMAGALRNLGFEVTEKVNLREKEMKRAIDDFGDRIRSGGVGLFYYAGHGAQVNGRNYMVPIGASIKGEGDVDYEAVDVGRVLGKMSDAQNRMNIVILDACRDNPYARSFRSASQGLAYINAPSGTIIAYATAPGSVASDNSSGANGLYTGELVKQMQKPGLRIEDVFKRVRGTVQEATGRKQVPWESVSIVGDFYFKLASGHMVIEKPRPEEKTTGSLRVETRPSGAAVYLDGARQEGVTPFVRSGLTPGKVKVRVVLEGYESQEKPLEVSAGKERFLKFLMDPLVEPEKPSVTGTTPATPGTSEPSGGSAEAGKTWREPVTGMEFVNVAGGCYQMGCGSWAGDCSDDEKPAHEVCLEGFWMGKYEVTQGEWEKVMGSNPSGFKQGSEYPVENVSWDDAREFVRKLNSRSGGSYRFILPSEAQWEYACRSGGKSEKYSGDESVDSVAWYAANSGNSTERVGSKAPNGLGLYDMSGNVGEWCEDIYDSNAYSKHQRNNPIYSSGGSSPVIRGGNRYDGPRSVRCANRNFYVPASRRNGLGFRLLRTNSYVST